MFCYYAVYYVACTLKRKSMTKEKTVLTDAHRAIDENIVGTMLFFGLFPLDNSLINVTKRLGG
ncbi:hypothetical protein PMF13cell1_04877 [Blautia producta]|uniref:Uncharacterized protein n=1 Tax=Blautia producta TaxID=33035 RepID=A0A4P6M6R7_9FIRM|nr:hypothetical protein PMF13cell1_04877 [Blautia producta]